jgi:hypothetical protein
MSIRQSRVIHAGLTDFSDLEIVIGYILDIARWVLINVACFGTGPDLLTPDKLATRTNTCQDSRQQVDKIAEAVTVGSHHAGDSPRTVVRKGPPSLRRQQQQALAVTRELLRMTYPDSTVPNTDEVLRNRFLASNWQFCQ